MKKYFKILGLEEDASKQEIEAAYNRLSKDLDPASNDNLDFFIEEYALVQEAYKKLLGSKIEPKITQEDSSTIDSFSLFNKDSTLISIIKKYRESNNSQKKEIKNYLKLKSGNKTYKDVLSIIEKEEKQKGIDKKNDKNPKPSKKSNKIRNLSIVLILFSFLLPYAWFLKKVNDIEKNIPIITKKSKLKQEESLDFWKAKLDQNHPKSWDEFVEFREDRSEIKDSLISFFIYEKTLKIQYYKKNFFKCVYQNIINERSWGNIDYYFKIRKAVWKKHKMSSDKLDMLIDLAGGINVFMKESPLEIDNECSRCIENYRNNFELNTVVLSDFYNFVSQYLNFEKEIQYANKRNQRHYNKVYKNQVSGMSKSLRNKLNSKLKNKPLFQNEQVYGNYRGSPDGLGLVTYSLQKKTKISELSLQNYVNEIYAEYYSTNSLRTGSTPYKYCYGPNASSSNFRSKIKIKNGNSDVIVTVKINNRVYRHIYIKSFGSFTFDVSNGSYDVYFYYGKGWNPNKFMKDTFCGKLTGGFVSNISISKDMGLYLNNQIMTYTLTSVSNGNFRPKDSSINEAF